jgi:hypothetical protein
MINLKARKIIIVSAPYFLITFLFSYAQLSKNIDVRFLDIFCEVIKETYIFLIIPIILVMIIPDKIINFGMPVYLKKKNLIYKLSVFCILAIVLLNFISTNKINGNFLVKNILYCTASVLYFLGYLLIGKKVSLNSMQQFFVDLIFITLILCSAVVLV